MNLYFHGGQCCGVKTIAGFPHFPKSSHRAYEREAVVAVRNYDANGSHVSTTKPFFTDAAPQETIEERFERLIKFCKRRRPQGVIEVCLARAKDGSWDQFNLWEPLLFKHGFKVTVPEFRNSNSGNYIKIYHLVYDATTEPKPKTTAVDPFGRSE